MAVDRDIIAAKLAHVEEQLASVRAKEIIVFRVGGQTTQTFADELAFQSDRADLLRWLMDADESDIRARLSDELAAIGDGAANVIALGNVQGLPNDIIRHVAFVELCQLAIGEHASQGERS